MYDKNKAAQDNDIEEKRLSYTTQNIRNSLVSLNLC